MTHTTARALARACFLLAALLLASAAVAPRPGQAQVVEVSDTVMQIELTDGSTIYGRIVAVDGERITIQTEAGARIEVTRAQIRSIRPFGGEVRQGQVWLEDPHGTRLFFAPTGRNLARGEGYFGVYELFFPFVTVGVTDRITIAGGTPVIPGLIGRVGYVAPKVQVVASERTNVGVGVAAAWYEDEGTAGIVYGVGTFGDRDGAFTVGAGFPFFTDGGDGDFADKPLVMLGGEARAGRRLKLLTENYFMVGESGALISGGVRFFGERLSADFGLGGVVGGEDFECCLPLVNFVYSWGK